MPRIRYALVLPCSLLLFISSAALGAEKKPDPNVEMDKVANKTTPPGIDGEAAGVPETIKEPPALPKEFSFGFSLPYGQHDEFPREPEEFDRMLGLLKKAGYNMVHCPYEPWRVELFKKHGMKMMVDVLAWKPPIEADIRRPSQRHKVKEMCEKLRGNDAIWGYNLWNERLDWCGNFQYLDAWVRMLRTWDPTHPVWVGTYLHLYCEHFPTEPGCHAWYDYAWSRGMGWNFKMLKFYRGIAEKHHGSMGKWLEMLDYNRDMYQIHTSIAHGVKTVLWFIGGPYAAREPDKSKRWHEEHHVVRIGRRLQPLYGLIGEMGLPYAVWSTPTLRDPSNRDKPLGLPNDTDPFPENAWLKVKQGEVLCGMFKLKEGAQIAYIVNHNAKARQGLVLDVEQASNASVRPVVVSVFDWENGNWNRLGARRHLSLPVAPADAAVLRFERTVSGTDIDR